MSNLVDIESRKKSKVILRNVWIYWINKLFYMWQIKPALKHCKSSKTLWPRLLTQIIFDSSRHVHFRKFNWIKNQFKFQFSHFFQFSHTSKDFMKACENKNFKLIFFLPPGSGREGLTCFDFLECIKRSWICFHSNSSWLIEK